MGARKGCTSWLASATARCSCGRRSRAIGTPRRPPASTRARAAAPQGELSCPVDGDCEHAGLRVASKYYHFTLLEVTGDPGMKKPDDVGRQGFFEALQRTYAHLYPDETHPLHGGPTYGCVARELHARSERACRRKAHFHCPCVFAAEHKWKAVERHLRVVEKLKARASSAQLGLGAD